MHRKPDVGSIAISLYVVRFERSTREFGLYVHSVVDLYACIAISYIQVVGCELSGTG